MNLHLIQNQESALMDGGADKIKARTTLSSFPSLASFLS